MRQNLWFQAFQALVLVLIMCPGCSERKNFFGIFGGKLWSRKRRESVPGLLATEPSPQIRRRGESQKEGDLNTKTELEPIGMVPMLILCYNVAYAFTIGKNAMMEACSPCIIDPFQIQSPKVWLRINVAYYQYYDFFRQLWRGFVSRVDE